MNQPSSKLTAKKQALEEIKALERRIELREGLPHLHGLKFYKWAREFFECDEKEQFLVAANQIGKSTTQIRKVIEWAGNPSLWPKLWPGRKPNQFWYLYPSRDLADAEFNTKWKGLLPAGKYKDHPTYGWKVVKERNMVKYIEFNSGVIVYFKTYNQDVSDLQAGTVYYVACDEELPVEFLSELQLRLAAVEGFFSMVFTATLGQDHWRRCMEPISADEETHINARKWNISMYDCLKYEDDSQSPWSVEKIEKIKLRCGTKAEVDRRVYGRFVVSGGLMFEAFDREHNTCEPFQIPPSWHIYSGIDCGSGGERGHPSAIVFIAIAPDYRRGVVFKGWRGDGVVTTASDTFQKYIEMRGGMKPTMQSYDWESKDFFVVASRLGEAFTPAEKGRDLGKQLLNTLFKNRMLKVFRNDPELDKLIVELTSLLEGTPKTSAKDDFADALRYSLMRIPFDWTAIEEFIDEEKPVIKQEVEVKLSERERSRRGIRDAPDPDHDSISDELEFWNSQY